MFGFTEKLVFMNARAVKVCTKTRILNNQAYKNLLFCQKIQRNVLSKGKS